MTNPHFKELRHAYGFDDVAIVPGDVTINPEQTSVELKIGNITLDIPILAAAMDGVTDVKAAISMGKLGGLAVLNLEGIHTRYENPDKVLEEITSAPQANVTGVLQKLYSAPIQDDLVAERVREIKKGGVACGVSVTPANTKRLAPIVAEAGADILFVQSTVTTARHVSRSTRGLIFEELCKSLGIPVVVGNCVSYSACLSLMKTGVSGVMVGVGPGAACTSRSVLGIGVPQITATMDSAAARDAYYEETGRYVPIITDGGFHRGGEICKAIAAGADGVMLGSVFAQAEDSPGKGYHWGMSHPHPALPRGTRIKVGTTGTLEQILYGPTSVTDGSQNLVGALKTAMGLCGASDISEMHNADMVIAPSIVTEGKFWQFAQGQVSK